MDEVIKITAKIDLFSGQNMLQKPIFSNYRPAFYFAGALTKLSGKINLIDRDSFLPGTSAIVQVTFIKGIISNDYFRKGETFTISEGGEYNLGKGEILEVITDKKISS